MNIIVVPPADSELLEAVDYYNDQLEGLGEQFYDSFLDTVRILLKRLISGEKSVHIQEG